MTARPAPDLRLEAGGVLAPPLARAHGIARAEVAKLLRRLRDVVPGLLGAAPPSGFLRVVERAEVLQDVLAAAGRLRRRRFEDLVHVGIGGSALGAETVLRARGKVAAFALLGRKGYERERAALARERPPRWTV